MLIFSQSDVLVWWWWWWCVVFFCLFICLVTEVDGFCLFNNAEILHKLSKLCTLLLFFIPSLFFYICVCSTHQLTEEKWSFFHSSRAHVHRPSCVAVEVERLNSQFLERKIGKSILGKVEYLFIHYISISQFIYRTQ